MIAERKRDPVAALVMHWTLVNGNHALRSERVMTHDKAFPSRPGAENKCHLAAKARFGGRRNQRWDIKAKQSRQTFPLLRQLLGVRDARQRAAAADAEVLAVQAT